MLVSFSLENYRSFFQEETFSMVASKRLSGSHTEHLVPIPGSTEHALKATVIYGANGAGKSNLFRALRFLKTIATRTRPKDRGTGRVPFRLGNCDSQPTRFDLQFVSNGKLYRFGCTVDEHAILEEWLVRVSGKRERAIYERATDSAGDVRISAKGLRAASDKLHALATIGGPKNQSFLATVLATLQRSELSDDIRAVVDWFENLKLIGPAEDFGPLGQLLSRDASFSEFAGHFLKSTSTGVDHLQVSKTPLTEAELEAILPKALLPRLKNDLTSGASEIVVQIGEGKELLIERADEDRYFRITVQAAHVPPSGDAVQWDLSEESDGTRRLLNLIPALHHAQTSDAVYFIDEIDRSLHPILIWKFFEFFLKSCGGGNRQIIVTTHESNLLDQELLRRDEIWFVEKDDKSATRVYSLADYQVRNDLEIRKHYLQGRFGAVPYLGSLERLREEISQE